MLDRKLFYDKPALDRNLTRVAEAGEENGIPWVRLEETIFHPEGGGQPADRGTISGVPVLDVRERDGRILHFVSRRVEPGPAETVLCRERRDDLSRQHTAQHLLTAILLERHGRRTTAFHLGEEYAAIEVTGAPISEEELISFEAEANAEIRKDRPVRSRWVTPEEYERLDVRSRGLPDGHHGSIRLVEIEGVDLNTCGGTHANRLAELQVVHLLGSTPARGGSRIRLLAGDRLLEAMRARGRTEADLRRRLGTGPEDFAKVLDTWREERKLHEARTRSLCRAVAEAICAQPGAGAGAGDVIRHNLPLADPEILRQVSRHVLAKQPAATVVLVGTDPGSGEACFLVQAGPEGPDDVSEEGAAVRDSLGARGGGRGKLFQGGAVRR